MLQFTVKTRWLQNRPEAKSGEIAFVPDLTRVDVQRGTKILVVAIIRTVIIPITAKYNGFVAVHSDCSQLVLPSDEIGTVTRLSQ